MPARTSTTGTARAVFACVDLFYGKDRPIPTFKVLEVLAGCPTSDGAQGLHRRHQCVGAAPHRPADFAEVEAHQQDNEQSHLILEELTRHMEVKEDFLRHRVLPRIG